MQDKQITTLVSELIGYFSQKEIALKQLQDQLKPLWVPMEQNQDQLLEKRFAFCKNILVQYLAKLSTVTKSDAVKSQFISMLLDSFMSQEKQVIWEDLQALREEDSMDYHDISDQCAVLGREQINQLVVLKLNGGLGTSMGCSGPKSAIKVIGSKTFLDIIAEQMTDLRKIHTCQIPFLLMNSFNTEQQTKQILSGHIDYDSFLQHQFPKVDAKTWEPFEGAARAEEEWYPPGHGDIFLALYEDGRLDHLIQKGCRIAFISNSDNLGAVVDEHILGYMLDSNLDMLMEMTPKTQLDVKGGTLVRYQNKLMLLERAQVEAKHIKEFEDITTFKTFNTNNVWVNLAALKNLIEQGGLRLPVIQNKKKVNNHPVLQLETAMGSAMNLFSRVASVIVPRDRFLPVKKVSDLFLLQSDLYSKKQGMITLNNAYKKANLPKIKFEAPLDVIQGYHQYISHIPIIRDLEELSLSGKIKIGPGVIFKGKVVIRVDSQVPYILENIKIENESIHIDESGSKR